MLKLVILLLGIGAGILQCQADCNVCAAGSNVACISDRHFQFCSGNRPVGPINACASGSYCTGQLAICQRNATLRACRNCGECNAARTFACTGPQTFALCLGGTSPTNLTGTCAVGSVCNANSASICGKANETSATCSWYTGNAPAPPPITTLTTLVISPDDVCRNTTLFSHKDHAIPNDTNCTSYIHCKRSWFKWVGRVDNCPRLRPFFNGRTLYCDTVKRTLPGCL